MHSTTRSRSLCDLLRRGEGSRIAATAKRTLPGYPALVGAHMLIYFRLPSEFRDVLRGRPSRGATGCSALLRNKLRKLARTLICSKARSLFPSAITSAAMHWCTCEKVVFLFDESFCLMLHDFKRPCNFVLESLDALSSNTASACRSR